MQRSRSNAGRRGRRDFYKRLYADPFMSFDIAAYVPEAWNEGKPTHPLKGDGSDPNGCQAALARESQVDRRAIQCIKADDLREGTHVEMVEARSVSSGVIGLR